MTIRDAVLCEHRNRDLLEAVRAALARTFATVPTAVRVEAGGNYTVRATVAIDNLYLASVRMYAIGGVDAVESFIARGNRNESASDKPNVSA
jgi:hypothetical protein